LQLVCTLLDSMEGNYAQIKWVIKIVLENVNDKDAKIVFHIPFFGRLLSWPERQWTTFVPHIHFMETHLFWIFSTLIYLSSLILCIIRIMVHMSHLFGSSNKKIMFHRNVELYIGGTCVAHRAYVPGIRSAWFYQVVSYHIMSTITYIPTCIL